MASAGSTARPSAQPVHGCRCAETLFAAGEEGEVARAGHHASESACVCGWFDSRHAACRKVPRRCREGAGKGEGSSGHMPPAKQQRQQRSSFAHRSSRLPQSQDWRRSMRAK